MAAYQLAAPCFLPVFLPGTAIGHPHLLLRAFPQAQFHYQFPAPIFSGSKQAMSSFFQQFPHSFLISGRGLLQSEFHFSSLSAAEAACIPL